MNDDDVLSTVRDALDGVRMRTPVREVVAVGRARRHRRLAGAAAGVASVTGLVLTLATVNAQVNAPPVTAGDRPSAVGGVHVRLAAFSVDTNPDGTVTVKMSKRQTLDPEIMQRTLAQAGVAAQITINKWCRPSDDSQNLIADFEKVVRQDTQATRDQTVHDKAARQKDKAVHQKDKTARQDDKTAGRHADDSSWMVITPSAMPQGTKLLIGMRTPGYQPDSPSKIAVSMTLVPDHAPLTCTTDVPS